MDMQLLVEDLKRERDRIDTAISALEILEDNANNARYEVRARTGPGNSKGRRHMSADARRRIGIGIKKRWAERKRLSAALESTGKKAKGKGKGKGRGKPGRKPLPPKKHPKKLARQPMSAAARAKIAKAAKARWAAAKKANPNAVRLGSQTAAASGA